MDASIVINRAYSATGKNASYGLGKGGMSPAAAQPTSGGKCDCSGFVAWCLGISRKTSEAFYVRKNGGWIETTAVAADIASSVGIFEPLTKPVPGCVVVYGDTVDGEGRHHEGHIAIVTKVNGRAGVGGITEIIHCSVSNDEAGDAIRATPATVFARNGKSALGWCILITP